jgi:hypothetical protein
MNTNKITNLSNGTLTTDAVAFGQLSDYYLNTITLNNITQPNGNLSLNSNKITNLSDPTLGTDALNR